MNHLDVTFKNSNEEELKARLEFPVSAIANSFALFIHCFEEGEINNAGGSICRELTMEGFAVMRFNCMQTHKADFEAYRKNSLAAVNFITQNYAGPKLLIGHGLGGFILLSISSKIEQAQAICTIGIPVTKSFVYKTAGNTASEVALPDNSFLKKLILPILMLHSPQDEIVPVEEAELLYNTISHPKSLVSLDGSTHHLHKTRDREFAASVIAAWVRRHIDLPENHFVKTNEDVAVQLNDHGYTTEVVAGKHAFIADEPEYYGGNDLGPSPYELLNAALGTCTAMTIKMYAEKKEIPLEQVTVYLSHKKRHAEDRNHAMDKDAKVDELTRHIEIQGNLSDIERAKLLKIAEKCPVHKTLTGKNITIKTTLR